MSTTKWVWAALLIAVGTNVVGPPPAQAEPLTPLTPQEIAYLDDLRQVFAVKHDPLAFNSDGELLDDGHYVCNARDHGLTPGASPDSPAPVFVGQGVTYLSPILIQVAFASLCPN